MTAVKNSGEQRGDETTKGGFCISRRSECLAKCCLISGKRDSNLVPGLVNMVDDRILSGSVAFLVQRVVEHGLARELAGLF